jgi:hypothetical protein
VRVQIEFVVLENIDSLLLTHFGILEMGSCGAAEDIPNLSCIGSAPTALTQQLGSHIYGDLDDPYEPGCGEPKFTEVPRVWRKWRLVGRGCPVFRYPAGVGTNDGGG